MVENTKTWVIEELEEKLKDFSFEDSLLKNELEKETSGMFYKNDYDFNDYWVLNVKNKARFNWDSLEELFKKNGKTMDGSKVAEYLNFYIYETLYGYYSSKILKSYDMNILGRSYGYIGVCIEDIDYSIDIDDSIIEMAIKSIDEDEDDYDFYEVIADWIIENHLSDINIDVSNFIKEFNALESEILKDSDYIESNQFVEDVYKELTE